LILLNKKEVMGLIWFKKEVTMKNLLISIYKSKSEMKPESVVTIPFATIHIAIEFLPKRVKNVLEKEGIDLYSCKDLVKEKDLQGILIEIENQNERMVLAVE